MTQQYLAGELSVLLAQLQAVETSEAHRRDVVRLRHEAETVPLSALAAVSARALAAIDTLCSDSLDRGNTAAFTREAATAAALHEFALCAGMLEA